MITTQILSSKSCNTTWSFHRWVRIWPNRISRSSRCPTRQRIRFPARLPRLSRWQVATIATCNKRPWCSLPRSSRRIAARETIWMLHSALRIRHMRQLVQEWPARSEDAGQLTKYERKEGGEVRHVPYCLSNNAVVLLAYQFQAWSKFLILLISSTIRMFFNLFTLEYVHSCRFFRPIHF